MKTALCLSGHLRSFRHTVKSLKKNVIDPLNCDVFIHTWDVIGAPPNGKSPADINFRTLRTVELLSEIYELYDPKLMQIESEEKIQEIIKQTNNINILPQDRQYIMNHVGYHVSMFYSISVSNSLRKEYEQENNQSYDLVIRCRPDLYFNTELNLNLFPNKNTIYIPEIGTYVEGGVNDQIAISTPNIMDSYTNIYPLITEYYRNRVCCPRPELLLKYHLDKNKIGISLMDIKYDLYRLDGAILRQLKMHAEWVPGANFYRNS